MFTLWCYFHRTSWVPKVPIKFILLRFWTADHWGQKTVGFFHSTIPTNGLLFIKLFAKAIAPSCWIEFICRSSGHIGTKFSAACCFFFALGWTKDIGNNEKEPFWHRNFQYPRWCMKYLLTLAQKLATKLSKCKWIFHTWNIWVWERKHWSIEIMI